MLPGEVNATATRGFLTRAFAELASGDFIPAGSAAYFLSPAEEVKTPYEAGVGRPFTAANIDFTTLDLSRNDNGVFPLTTESRETGSPAAIVLADRAIGDGNDPATRSSVWTQPGSGDWRGTIARNDGSTSFEVSPALTDLSYGSLGVKVEALSIDNLFSSTFALEANATRVTARSGLLYDEADPGTDPNAF